MYFLFGCRTYTYVHIHATLNVHSHLNSKNNARRYAIFAAWLCVRCPFFVYLCGAFFSLNIMCNSCALYAHVIDTVTRTRHTIVALPAVLRVLVLLWSSWNTISKTYPPPHLPQKKTNERGSYPSSPCTDGWRYSNDDSSCDLPGISSYSVVITDNASLVFGMCARVHGSTICVIKNIATNWHGQREHARDTPGIELYIRVCLLNVLDAFHVYIIIKYVYFENCGKHIGIMWVIVHVTVKNRKRCYALARESGAYQRCGCWLTGWENAARINAAINNESGTAAPLLLLLL